MFGGAKCASNTLYPVPDFIKGKQALYSTGKRPETSLRGIQARKGATDYANIF